MPNVILDWDKKAERGVIISEHLDIIRLHFSVANKAKDIIERRYGGSGHIPSRMYVINDTGRFDLGLYFEILYFLNSPDNSFDVHTTDLLQEQVLCGFDYSKTTPLNLSLNPFDYQQKSIERCIRYGYGVILLGTGGGKTLIMASLSQKLRQLLPEHSGILIILPAHLVEQTYKEYSMYGIPEDQMFCWKGNELEVKPIIFASVSTLYAKLGSVSSLSPKPKKKSDTDADYKIYVTEFEAKEKMRVKIWKKTKIELLKQLSMVNAVLIDEVHALKRGNQLNKIVEMFPTKHRFGFTGTLPEEEIDKWNIIGKIGPIIENINSYELRQKDILTTVNAQIIQLHYKDPPNFKGSIDDPTKAYREECNYLYMHEFRNKIILNICKRFDNNSLIIVDKLDHGLHLFNHLKANVTGKQIFWLCGEVEMEDREKLRELMEKDSNIICIAMSKIFSVGVNIKNLHYIIFAQGGKAKVTMIQSIGRGLRKHESKDQLIIIDIADTLHYGIEHLGARIKRYDEEKIPYEIKVY